MALVVNSSKKDYENPETGPQPAVCTHVVDLGIQTGTYGDKHKLAIVWELGQKMKDGRPFLVNKQYGVSMGKKSTLRKDLGSWRGKHYSDEEVAAGVDVEKLVGVQATLYLVENASGDSIYINVDSIAKAAPGQNIQPTGNPPPQWLLDKAKAGQAKLSSTGGGFGAAVDDQELPF
jgi:hypothetical protein